MLENHAHYFEMSDPITVEVMLDKLRNEKYFKEPLFAGQGWSKQVGSDCYGGYIVAVKDHPKRKGQKMFGLVSAKTEMGPAGWTAGTEYCSLPEDKTPQSWIMQSGWWKHRDGHKSPKWYFCDENGIKFKGQHCRYSWNGASSYRDPSF